MTTLGEIRLADGDGVRRVTIDRPSKRNALTRPMMRILADAFAEADRDPGVSAILLDATGNFFCAGADLAGLSSGVLSKEDDPGYDLIVQLAKSRKPLICAVQGPAVGMAVTMLLHFDLVFAAQGATFQTPFSELGLTPEGGSSFLLPGLMGVARAARLLLLGETVDARSALASGLISEIVDAQKIAARARSAAVALACKPPLALAQTKNMMRGGDLIEKLDHEQAIFRRAMEGDEFRDAVAQALEKLAAKRSARREVSMEDSVGIAMKTAFLR
jgi:enoyl-CoA hydratase/carnithine racemase